MKDCNQKCENKEFITKVVLMSDLMHQASTLDDKLTSSTINIVRELRIKKIESRCNIIAAVVVTARRLLVLYWTSTGLHLFSSSYIMDYVRMFWALYRYVCNCFPQIIWWTMCVCCGYEIYIFFCYCLPQMMWLFGCVLPPITRWTTNYRQRHCFFE